MQSTLQLHNALCLANDANCLDASGFCVLKLPNSSSPSFKRSFSAYFLPLSKMRAPFAVVLLAILYGVSCSAATINCTQTRVPGSPGPNKIGRVFVRYANQTCQRLKPDKLQVHMEGYELTVNAWPIDSTACAAALEQLVQECVTDRKFFGGIIDFEDRTYNLSNVRYPKSPLRTKPHHSHSSTGTMPMTTSGATSCHLNTASSVPTSSVIQALNKANSSIADLNANQGSNSAKQNAIDAVDQAANGTYILL